jgi:SAM-dependent MidA family methyltransferase
VHASPLFAGAVLELLHRVDRALDRPDRLDLVDVGAGRGELLATVRAAAEPVLRRRLRLTAVEVGPVDVPGVRVVRDVAALPPLTGLLLANEWLDDVPLDVVEQTADGPRVVLVAPTGAESMGGPPGAADAAWLARWWPLAAVGERAEVGRSRDEAWAAAVGRLTRGVAVAVDYGHEAGARPEATLTGYRGGVPVGPVPDGSCDLTAHVALDSVAAAGVAAGATETRLDDQRAALQALGVDARRPPHALATTDPAAYLRGLQRAGEAAELIERGGLGSFGWLVQGVGVPLPFPPLATRARVRRKPAPPG